MSDHACGTSRPGLFQNVLNHCALGVIVSLFSASSFAKDVLPIFYASMLPAKDRQDVIKRDLAKDDFDPMVFAKYRDFISQVETSSPLVVIAPASFQRQHSDYHPILRFSEGTTEEFKYLLLSLTNTWTPKSAATGRLGMVEELDRDHLKETASEAFGVNFKMVKSVSKLEDLFPLLVFKSADFIMISPENYERLKERFSAKLYIVMEGKPVSRPMVFTKTGADSGAVTEKLKAMPPAVLTALGFSGIGPVGKASP